MPMKELFTRLAKEASDEKGAYLIADIPTIRERASMPQNVTGVMDMQHPGLKYLTIAGGVGGALLGQKFYKKSPSLGMMGGLAAGNIIGSNAQSELERHYAKPYLKKISEHTSKKYKTANASNIVAHKAGTEYIFDGPTNFSHGLKESTPHEIRTMLEYKHPIIARIPMIGAGIGGLIALKKGKLLPLAIGVAGGHAVRELVFDQKMKPYKQKFIAEVNKEYGVK